MRLITGIGASPGVLEGIARVVRTVDEFDEVRDGDILVCQMTNPAWVVLFTKIAGLVTDTGGPTSHPAVLAREFGIPAVIGTSVATQRIATGDRIADRRHGRAGGDPAGRGLSRRTTRRQRWSLTSAPSGSRRGRCDPSRTSDRRILETPSPCSPSTAPTRGCSRAAPT